MTHRIENSIEVPGTPEEVWEAIATGHGIECWFVPARVEGGRVALDLGAGLEDAGPVTAFEPPRRFALEEAWQDGRLATEFLVEAKAGGTCVVRLVSTFHGEIADDALDSLHAGWTVFLLNLRAYRTHFPGRRCATAVATAVGDWDAFERALGLDGATAGAHVATTDAPTLAGTVEYRGAREVLLRLDAPAPGTALVSAYDLEGETHLAVRLYLFDDSAAVAAREAAAWRDWMAVPSAG
jgi:uncharacterized protein YndB with AHSA1/START domain